MTSAVFVPIVTPAPDVGDIKFSLLTADHAGWVRLDGRALTALTATQQAAAATLPFVGNLPDPAGRTLRTKPLATTGGTASTARTIAKANLPAYTMAATTNNPGNTHTHGLSDTGPFRSQQTPPRARATNTNGGSPAVSIDLTTDGAHTHTYTLPNGGGGAAIDVRDAWISVSAFLYLGA